MSVEIQEIRNHISRFPPFDRLSAEMLDDIAENIEIAYFKAGSEITRFGEPIHHLGYVRSGAVEVFRHDGQLYNRLSEGGIFGHFGLLRNQQVRYPTTAIEDCLIYFIPEQIFNRLCAIDGYFADFVEHTGSSLQASVEQQQAENDMLVTRVRRLLSRAPVMMTADQTVREAAQRMTAENVSAVLVIRPPTAEDDPARVFTGQDKEQWFASGIITDRDLRIRVLAEGFSADLTLESITTHALVCIQSDKSVYEAMLAMLRANVHHLPVLHRRRPVGIVHLSDIVRYETRSSLYLVSNIASQPDVRGLERLMPDVRAAFVRLVEDGANGQMVGSAISTIGRALMRRIIELAERELGPPPVTYCFMTNGSMARNEQSIVTDQDNAMILADDFNPEEHDAYFKALAEQVSAGLDACGYTYCKGGIMATTDRWRQPISVWRDYFRDWIEQPDPERLLHSSIFFDLDCVYGDAVFVEQLQDLIAEQARKQPLFLAAMARNALNRTPPLGLFRKFVLEQDGRQNNAINIKRRGTAPMIDLVRIHALAIGSRAQNTYDRIEEIKQANSLPAGVADKLHYAFEFLSTLRVRHQANELRQHLEPSNNVIPEQVSPEERHNLKEAFSILSNAQKYLKYRYPMPTKR